MKTRKAKAPTTSLMLMIAVVIFSSGCATTTTTQSFSGDQAQTVLAKKNVKPETQEKFVRGEALSLEDIRHLSSKNIDSTLIVEAIERSQIIYQLESEDVSVLKTAGVDDTVIDALLLSPHRAISGNSGFSKWHYGFSYSRFGYHRYGHRRFGYRPYGYRRGYHGFHCY